MAYTFEQLRKMTVTELRLIADGVDHEAVKGHSTMHKEKLLPALCLALGIVSHAHHEVHGINKSSVKMQIRALKRERDQCMQGKDPEQLRHVRQEIHHLKRILRKSVS